MHFARIAHMACLQQRILLRQGNAGGGQLLLLLRVIRLHAHRHQRGAQRSGLDFARQQRGIAQRLSHLHCADAKYNANLARTEQADIFAVHPADLGDFALNDRPLACHGIDPPRQGQSSAVFQLAAVKAHPAVSPMGAKARSSTCRRRPRSSRTRA